METNQKNQKTLLERAIYYSQLGWSIFPVGQDKKPLLDWKKYQSEFPTQDDLNKWFTDTRTKGIGIATGSLSKLIVLDIDKGADTTGLHLSPTPTVKTGGGGWHYYYKYPVNKNLRNSVGSIREHIDIRAEGGYVIAPPSLHISGNRYEWCDALSPEDIEVADIPRWLLERITHPDLVKTNFKQIIKGVNEGQRNDSATALIGKLISYMPTYEWEEIGWQLLLICNEKNNPPLTVKELRGIFVSISKRELIKRGPDTNTKNLPKPLSIGDIFKTALESRPFLVEKLLPEKGLIAFSGQAESGKSWVTLYIAHCIATDQPVFGQFAVKQGGVLMVDEEGGAMEFHKRMKMLGIKPEHKIYLFSQEEFKVDFPEHLNHLLNTAKELDVKLVIFDPFSAIHSKNENSADDIQKVMQALQQFNRAGIAVIFIHHHRKEHFMNKNASPSTGLRGSTVLFTRVDSHIAITKDRETEEGLEISLEQAKLRRGKKEKKFTVRLKINDQEQKASFEYLGEAKPELIKKEEAKEFILEELTERPDQAIEELLVKAKEGNIGKTAVEDALKEMRAQGLIIGKTKPGMKRKLFYSVPQVDQSGNEPIELDF